MKAHSYWRIGGPADLLVEPGTIEQVQSLVRGIRNVGLPYVVIGDGSNLLFDDQGVRGVVLKIGRQLGRYSITGSTVTAEAGVFVPRLVRQLGKTGLSGLEHAVGIPGTLGGLLLMNGGSLRKCISTSVDRVWAVDATGELVCCERDACGFAYRRSAFQETNAIVVQARLRCQPADSLAIRREMLSILRARRAKFPRRQPNCGSVFLSDSALYGTVGPPGKIIEDAGLKGFRIGDAMISCKHANFIVNLGGASSQDVLRLIRWTRERVHERIGIWLRCEVRYVSTHGEVGPVHGN